jgi:DNA-binding GntR family transcriptional regulator
MVDVELNANDPRSYVRMAVMIRQQIAEGNLQPGDPTPSIETMAEEYRHARQTCAKALRLLVDEGLAHRVPGLGYYVTVDAIERLTE